MMKKALSLFLAAAMCAGMLAGCGGGADTNDASNGDSGESTAAAFKIGGIGSGCYRGQGQRIPDVRL